MIELYISPDINSHLQIKKKFDDSHVALKIIYNYKRTIPKLKEGNITYRGVKAITNFFNEIEF